MISRFNADDNTGIPPRRLPDIVTPEWLRQRRAEFRITDSWSGVRDETLSGFCGASIHHHGWHRELNTNRTLALAYFAEVRISSRLLELDQITTRAAA